MSFENFSFDPRIASAIRATGYDKPTPIQAQAIPKILEGRDVLGLAQTGTGKTAAFILPMLERLIKKQATQRKARALILAPTRELAEQIHQTAVKLGRETGLRSFPVYGGVGKGPQIDGFRRGTEIVIACPGRLLDHIQDRTADLSQIEILVLDEADRMCDMGFLPDIRRILAKLPRERQTLFFSATMPNEIRTLSNDLLRNPATVQIDVAGPAKTVQHALFPVHESLKARLLSAMIKSMPDGRVLVFTRTKHRAKRLAQNLGKEGGRVAMLQGNMSQNKRQEAMKGFQSGKYDVLVATDIAARGIDVADISHVINFDMPDTADTYIHRIGRTGRAAQTGDAFTFSTPSDEDTIRGIEKILKSKIERKQFPNFDYSVSAEAMQSRPPQPHHGGRPGHHGRPSRRPHHSGRAAH